MSKRKRTNQQKSSSKKIKQELDLNFDVPAPNESFLAPFIQKDKFRINGRIIKRDNIGKNLTYKMFHHDKWNNLLKKAEEDLARFIPEQLVNLESVSQEKSNGTFDYLNLTTEPYYPKPNVRADFYDMEFGSKNKQVIRISPFNDETNGPVNMNPYITLIHEGTHALDDLYMRIYQNEAINKLSQIEKKKDKNIVNEPNWYEQAQNILNIADFKKHYPYESENAKNNILSTFKNLQIDRSNPTENSEEVTNFNQSKEILEWIRTKEPENAIEGKHFYSSLSEFSGFSVQNIANPWNISDNERDANYWKNQNDGRVFLKAIMKGVQDNFLELDSEFIEKYPDAYAAFNDRIYQLGNFDKLSNLQPPVQNAQDYFAYRERQKKLKAAESLVDFELELSAIDTLSLNKERHNHRLSAQIRPESAQHVIQDKQRKAESSSDNDSSSDSAS